jgi:hypothetical protein
MSEENVEVVRRTCAAWERGKRRILRSRARSGLNTSAFPDSGTYSGGRVALDAWRSWLEAWDEFGMELEDVIDAGAPAALSR